jgi:hypothetical protein
LIAVLEIRSTSGLNCETVASVIATLFATPKRFKRKSPPRSLGRFFLVFTGCLGVRHFCLIFKQNRLFLWSWRDSNLRPHRCERCVLTLRRMLRDQLNYKTLFCSICNISPMSATPSKTPIVKQLRLFCNTYTFYNKHNPKSGGCVYVARYFAYIWVWARRDSNPRLLLCDCKVSSSNVSNASISCVSVWIFAFFRGLNVHCVQYVHCVFF